MAEPAQRCGIWRRLVADGVVVRSSPMALPRSRMRSQHMVRTDRGDRRSGVRLDNWLTERGSDCCAKIALATLDPAAGYRRALIDNLPNATLVVDHFHAIKLANKAIDDTAGESSRPQQVTGLPPQHPESEAKNHAQSRRANTAPHDEHHLHHSGIGGLGY